MMSFTTDKNDPRLNQPKDNGQNEAYLILSEEERKKGFIRPVRRSYTHMGRKINLEEGTVRDLTPEEKRRYGASEYVAFLVYPKERAPIMGKFLTQEEIDNNGKRIGGCKTITTMDIELAETYARSPTFYGATFCTGCNKHLPVDQFVWEGTDETVGS